MFAGAADLADVISSDTHLVGQSVHGALPSVRVRCLVRITAAAAATVADEIIRTSAAAAQAEARDAGLLQRAGAAER